MKVKMLTEVSAPPDIYQLGKEHELPDHLAISFIRAGQAEPAVEKPEPSPAPEPKAEQVAKPRPAGKAAPKQAK